MRVLRSGDYTRMPWKNGGGETVEMIVSPHGATLDGFDWRISMAHVAVPGPFSTFPGIDRTLSVIAGNGFSLVVDGQTIAFDRTSAPFRFAGDVRVESVLVGGAIDDLNVMTRRGRCDHRVTCLTIDAQKMFRWEGDACVGVTIGGDVEVRIGAEIVTLAARDALVLEAEDARDVVASSHGEAEVFVVEIFDV